jgi:hypothetical protein
MQRGHARDAEEGRWLQPSSARPDALPLGHCASFNSTAARRGGIIPATRSLLCARTLLSTARRCAPPHRVRLRHVASRHIPSSPHASYRQRALCAQPLARPSSSLVASALFLFLPAGHYGGSRALMLPPGSRWPRCVGPPVTGCVCLRCCPVRDVYSLYLYLFMLFPRPGLLAECLKYPPAG